jgi:hypothetical protein
MSNSSHSKAELREKVAPYHTPDTAIELPSSRLDSRPPVLNPTEYAAWCERMRKDLNLADEKPDHRLAAKNFKEFVW